jgi:hypothetical protein
LPESAARSLPPEDVDNLGDWPISTDRCGRDGSESEHRRAFSGHWRDAEWHKRVEWFYGGRHDHPRRLLQAACEAMREVELSGLLDSFPKTDGFKIIIADHDELDEMSVDRYSLFLRTGEVRCMDDDDV